MPYAHTADRKAYDRARYERRKAEDPDYWRVWDHVGNTKRRRAALCPIFRMRLDMLRNAQRRAKESGLTFGLNIIDTTPVPATCPVLGIPLLAAGPTDNRPVLDRIDNSKGYVPDNIWIISFRANRFKSDMTLADLKAFIGGPLLSVMESAHAHS